MYAVIAGNVRAVERESFMMFAGEYEIFHAGVLRHLYDGIGIETGRIELPCKLFIFRERDAQIMQYPFCDILSPLVFIFAREQ